MTCTDAGNIKKWLSLQTLFLPERNRPDDGNWGGRSVVVAEKRGRTGRTEDEKDSGREMDRFVRVWRGLVS